jgi:hypothetical protein
MLWLKMMMTQPPGCSSSAPEVGPTIQIGCGGLSAEVKTSGKNILNDRR